MPIFKDIPVAQRLSSSSASKPPRTLVSNLERSLRIIPWWGYSLALVAFLIPIAAVGMRHLLLVNSNPSISKKIFSQAPNPPTFQLQTANLTKPIPTPNLASPQIESSVELSTADLVTQIPLAAPPTRSTMFGHFAYAEAPPQSLQAIGQASDGYEIKLRITAARQYLDMVSAARQSGIDLFAISGFRSLALQKQLFFDISKQRNQTPAQRAQVSAPPGFSEHHTGYAVDIGDSANPSTNLSQSFDRTAAFKWLEKNGARFGFELSFPIKNAQGVMYEPWHWRFVGDQESLTTFYKNSNEPKLK